ncbi:MAG TPA: NAD(P)/FAD-dependent oxidoreductase [Vicinamibacterales bacterium]|jgi:NADH dehydrogenase
MPRVVIIGGGFGGLYAARALKGAPVDVTIVDRRNHHVFQPLLYQVATAGLSPGDIASPIRWILRKQRNTEVLLGEVDRVELAKRVIHLKDGFEIPYDFLIIAAGATHAYFGHDDWQNYAPGLKSLEDALVIRRRVLLAFERAERETDPARRQTLLTFVVVGGGPTGVELAGALAEIARQSLTRDFRHFDPGSARIVLLEAGPSVLATFPEPLRESARHDLERLGVDVRTNTPVTRVGPACVETATFSIAAETILWAAGVAAASLGTTLGVPVDRAGRVLIDANLTIPGHPEVFVIGDLASLKGPDGMPYPGVAQVAIQMGVHAVHNILRTNDGRPMRPFVYRNLGNMATIGREAAVADFGWLRLHGLIGWIAWLFVHIFNLIGFRNRIVVMIQWSWAYVTYQRSVRLITGDTGARS